MKVSLWVVGNTNEKYLEEGIAIYTSRLKHYCKFEFTIFKDIKGVTSPDILSRKESEAFLEKLKSSDELVLLDEYGEMLSSQGLATFIEKRQIQSEKSLVFIIGGAYGHHSILKNRADKILSFSKMTFSHQMIRLFAVEQIYRAYTIIKNEKYHNG